MASVANSDTLGSRIRRLRERKGIRQVDLAAKAGISWRHLIRIEQDRGGVTKQTTIARLAVALGVEVEELTGDEDDEEADSVPLDELLRRAIRQVIREETSA